jgi:hypothetical protein
MAIRMAYTWFGYFFQIPILATALRQAQRQGNCTPEKQVKKNHSPVHQQTASKPYQAYNL